MYFQELYNKYKHLEEEYRAQGKVLNHSELMLLEANDTPLTEKESKEYFYVREHKSTKWVSKSRTITKTFQYAVFFEQRLWLPREFRNKERLALPLKGFRIVKGKRNLKLVRADGYVVKIIEIEGKCETARERAEEIAKEKNAVYIYQERGKLNEFIDTWYVVYNDIDGT